MELTTLGLKKPTQSEFYDISIHNENMDLLNSLIKNLSNENLLVNGDFKVNQRGQSSYTITGWTPTYSVDCWETTDENAVVTVLNKGVNISLSSSGAFRQMYKNYEDLKGKTVTLSAKVSNLTGNKNLKLYIHDDELHSNDRITEDGIISITHTISSKTTSLAVGLYNNVSQTSPSGCDIEYIKLEVSEFPTPNEPTDYNEELLKCQRYYIKYTLSSRLFEAGLEGGRIVIDLPVTMADGLSVDYFDTTMSFIKMGDESATSITVTNIGVWNVSNNTVTLAIAAPFNFTTWTQCACESLEIALSAELK